MAADYVIINISLPPRFWCSSSFQGLESGSGNQAQGLCRWTVAGEGIGATINGQEGPPRTPETSRFYFWALTHPMFQDPSTWVGDVFISYHSPGKLRVAITQPCMSPGAGTTDPQPSTSPLLSVSNW